MRLARIFTACALSALSAMALVGCKESTSNPNEPTQHIPYEMGDALYDIQGPPNPLWDRTPLDPAKMLTLTYALTVHMSKSDKPQTLNVTTLGYCETVESQPDYNKACRKIIGKQLEWAARESLTGGTPFDLQIATANPDIRPNALFEKRVMIWALGHLPKQDLYTVIDIKPQ